MPIVRGFCNNKSSSKAKSGKKIMQQVAIHDNKSCNSRFLWVTEHDKKVHGNIVCMTASYYSSQHRLTINYPSQESLQKVATYGSTA
jgi:hypothetical protein